MNPSSDSSRWTATTPANSQGHPAGESQCGSALDLTRQIVRREIYPTLSGTYSDVWRSTWCHDKRKRDVSEFYILESSKYKLSLVKVAVKSVKIPFLNEDEKSNNRQVRSFVCVQENPLTHDLETNG